LSQLMENIKLGLSSLSEAVTVVNSYALFGTFYHAERDRARLNRKKCQ
jgi:hypothetical protein